MYCTAELFALNSVNASKFKDGRIHNICSTVCHITKCHFPSLLFRKLDCVCKDCLIKCWCLAVVWIGHVQTSGGVRFMLSEHKKIFSFMLMLCQYPLPFTRTLPNLRLWPRQTDTPPGLKHTVYAHVFNSYARWTAGLQCKKNKDVKSKMDLSG